MMHCDAKPAQLVVPCRRKWNDGPLQAVTTQKHDYVPKPLIKTCSYKPIMCPVAPEIPMEGKLNINILYYNFTNNNILYIGFANFQKLILPCVGITNVPLFR